MTVGELKKLLECIADDVIIEVKNDCGEYDIAEDGYTDIESYWKDWSAMMRREPQRTRKVFKIY